MARARSASSIPRTGGDGLGPNDFRSAYFPGERPDAPVGEPQTVALVDATTTPTPKRISACTPKRRVAGVPPCTDGAVSDWFEQVNQEGETGNLPVAGDEREREVASQWAGEVSIDIEVTHGICRNCRILLVEASAARGLALEAAEKTAERLGATEVSDSWTGGNEQEPIGSPFDDPGVVITAGSGDWGYLGWAHGGEYGGGVNYPAASPNVIVVGGTELTLTEAGARASETVWNEGAAKEKDVTGGGCSSLFDAPPGRPRCPTGPRSAAAPAHSPNARSPTSPRTALPTPGRRSTTRCPTTSGRASRCRPAG